MNRIDEDIKTGKWKQVYLLYGEERYLVRQYRDRLKKALMGDGDAMNLTVYEGSDFSVGELIDLAETLPFFAERRVILVENSGFFKYTAANPAAALADYLAEIPETASILFVEETVDKRSRMYKAAAKYGAVTEFGKQKEETLAKWVTQRVKKEGKNITQGAYECFISRTGTDMENIDRELEKLLCYVMDKDVIREEDVESITTEQTENQVFVMVDAIVEHQQKQALTLYYDLLSLKEPPMRILYLILRQFQILFVVKTMSNQGFSSKEIAAKAGCPEWAVSRRYLRQCRRLSLDLIRRVLREGTEYEEAVKTGRMDGQLAVELLIVGIGQTEES